MRSMIDGTCSPISTNSRPSSRNAVESQNASVRRRVPGSMMSSEREPT